MKEPTIRLATDALKHAKRAAADLETSETFPAANRAWSEFLVQANRVYLKLKEGTKGQGPTEAWFGRKTHERKRDSLLQYLHHARNADEHTLSDTKPHVKPLGIHPPEITKPGNQTVTITVQFSVVGHLVPVVDYGETYDVPTAHIGKTLDNPTPVSVAQLAIDYLEHMIEEAKSFV